MLKQVLLSVVQVGILVALYNILEPISIARFGVVCGLVFLYGVTSLGKLHVNGRLR